MMRSMLCGEVRENQVGKDLTLSGWVHSRRDHGGVLFIDLRDRSGLVQIVFNPSPAELFKQAEQLRSEFVIQVKGTVRPRPQGTINPNLPTGKIEVLIESLHILNPAKTPPFEISEFTHASEEVGLKNRPVDLRRPQLQRNMILRHQVVQEIRNYFNSEGFLDIETPMLTRSTPEGARDFLVPARLNPGMFYALPQSPQIFKQLLMVSGFDRYYQIARCFRDEDLRADRQPEFTQIDVEMSFVDEEDIQSTIEKMIQKAFKISGISLSPPFPRMKYDEARQKYGTDRPDLRISTEIIDATSIFQSTQFERIKSNIQSGGGVKALVHKGGASFSRKEIDDLTKFAQSVGAKGLAWLKCGENNQVESPISKFLSPDEISGLQKLGQTQSGDIIFLVADKIKLAENVLGAVRIHLWNKYSIKGTPPPLKDSLHLLWITDFPLFEWSDEEKRWASVHHPFTAPRDEDIKALSTLDASKEITNPDSILGQFRARAYDLVLNGTELGGGSIRIHNGHSQKLILKLLGLDDEEIKDKFGFLIEGLESGAPPHGGIALGLDRLIALLVGEDSIRDVIAFPKTQKGTCLTSGAPGKPDFKQLRELGLASASKKAPPPEQKRGVPA